CTSTRGPAPRCCAWVTTSSSTRATGCSASSGCSSVPLRSCDRRGGRRAARPTYWEHVPVPLSHRPTRRAQCTAMDVESRDSVSLKPAELDVLAQVLAGAGSGFVDEHL